MASVGLIFEVVIAVQMLTVYTTGFVILEDKDVNVQLSDVKKYSQDNVEDKVAVHHYARHGLCKSFAGKRRLYNAMKTRFCNISLSLIQGFVMDLCRHKYHMLGKWVKELFDIDGDGSISHFEKHYYT